MPRGNGRPTVTGRWLVTQSGDALVSDYRWQVLVNARPAIVAAFVDDGVVRVEYVSALPAQQPFAVLCRRSIP